MIGIVATLKIKEGKADEFEAAFKDLQKQVQANEAGNLMYEVFRSREDELTYIIMEKYTDDAAVEAHGKSDHFKAGGAKLGAVLAAPPQVQILDGI